MNRESVSSSIDIDNLRNAFSFHIKCGEIYYIQPVNEILIICNLCNNENFDKYENFLRHFSLCYSNLKANETNMEQFVASKASNFKKENEISLFDVAPVNLSEDDDDDEEDITNKEKPENESDIDLQKLIPTIEINDTDTEQSTSQDGIESKKNDKNVSNDNASAIENNTQHTNDVNNIVKNEPSLSQLENLVQDTLISNFNDVKSFKTEMLIDQQVPSVINQSAFISGLLPQLSQFPPLSYNKLMNPKFIKSEKRPHQCPECGKCFAQRINLVTHFRTHTGEKPYKCTRCDNAYPQKSNLDAHMLKHTGFRPYGCEDCGKRFYQMSHLLAHERTHTGERPYICEECNRTFSQLSHLSAHKRNTHSELLYKCSICTLPFSNMKELTMHQILHLGQSPIDLNEMDNLCETIVETKDQNVDVNNTTPNNALQDTTNNQKTVSPVSNIPNNVKENESTGAKPETNSDQIMKTSPKPTVNSQNDANEKNGNEDLAKRYECQFCDKKFYKPNHLTLHLKSHQPKTTVTQVVNTFAPTTSTEEQTVISNTTEKSESSVKLKFKFKQNPLGLKRKHECDDCGKKFALVTDLKAHQRKKH